MEGAIQKDLVITGPFDEVITTADDLEMAQFLYLLQRGKHRIAAERTAISFSQSRGLANTYLKKAALRQAVGRGFLSITDLAKERSAASGPTCGRLADARWVS